jgi:hypothetical protein
MQKTDGSPQEIPCVFQEEHKGETFHLGRTAGGMYIRWSEEDAREAREKWQTENGCFIKKEPLVGWRTWKLSWPSQTHLMSTAAGDKWTGPRMTTLDFMRVTPHWGNVAPKHRTKSPLHDFGVFSYKNPVLLMRYFEVGSRTLPVVGRLDLTGHIVEHEFGSRAQSVMIRELWLVKESLLGNINPTVTQAHLQEHYECPVHLIPKDQLKAWAAYYTKEHDYERDWTPDQRMGSERAVNDPREGERG